MGRLGSRDWIRGSMGSNHELVLLGPGDVVINIKNNNMEPLPDLHSFLEECEGGCRGVQGKEGRMDEEARGRRDGRGEVPVFRAKRGRPCSSPPSREVITKRRKVP